MSSFVLLLCILNGLMMYTDLHVMEAPLHIEALPHPSGIDPPCHSQKYMHGLEPSEPFAG
jgi:hypothetical protein